MLVTESVSVWQDSDNEIVLSLVKRNTQTKNPMWRHRTLTRDQVDILSLHFSGKKNIRPFLNGKVGWVWERGHEN